MSTIATCAGCGEEKELCLSTRIDGVSQPRMCAECLRGGSEVKDLYWGRQIIELNDVESLEVLLTRERGSM